MKDWPWLLLDEPAVKGTRLAGLLTLARLHGSALAPPEVRSLGLVSASRHRTPAPIALARGVEKIQGARRPRAFSDELGHVATEELDGFTCQAYQERPGRAGQHG